MNTIYFLTWYFFIYSFIGWCLEIIYAAVKKHHFLNRGVLNGPLCPVYGLGMILSLIFFHSLKNEFIFLIAGCAVIATLLEYFTGALMEKLFRKKWWDYSGYKYNLGGYVCIPFSALWGLTAALALKFFHPLLYDLISRIPSFPGHLILLVLLILLTADILSVLGVIFQVQKRQKQLEDLTEDLQKLSLWLTRAIFTSIEKRMVKAHPASAAVLPPLSKSKSTVFAQGCSFYKLIWLFFLGSFLGDITETIFCYFTAGKLMIRSSVVYGPFSIFWGLAIVILTIMLYKYRDKEDRYIFIFGTIVGGAYEYICSVFTELVFGTVFWDYSRIPFNLGGRINLLYCFFWGLAAVVWIKILYPFLSRLIEKIPMKAGKFLSWCILIFMIFNMSVSALALARYSDRQISPQAENTLEAVLDQHFPDDRMNRIYPNAKMR